MVESLIGTLIGAMLALITTWWITPRLERRNRADDRRDQATVELHRMLVEEGPYIANDLRSAWASAHAGGHG